MSPQPTTPPAQRPAGSQRGARYAAAAGAAATAAGAATAVAPVPVAATGAGAASVTAAGVLSGFVSFLAALESQHRVWLARDLARYGGQTDDLARLANEELTRGREFARRAADRLASALPQALAITDPQQRAARVRQLLADEERFARQRTEAMAARAIAAVQRADLRRVSPMGAYWRLGLAHKHTEGCLLMHGKFWPWSVLDRVHPPRHYGCTSDLLGYGDAILGGLMGPSDVPDERVAIRAASGVLMEGEADALLAELDVRERLLELGIDTSEITFKGVGDGSKGR